MALLPLASKDGPKPVLSLQPDEDHWLDVLMKLESNATKEITLKEVANLDYSCMRLCGVCWESNPTRMKQRIFAFFTKCKHVCCFECMLRWLFLCGQKRCPLCMSLESTNNLKETLDKFNLPYLQKPERDYSFGYSDWSFLDAESNNSVAFTWNLMLTTEAANIFFATLNGDYPFVPFHQLKQNITFLSTGEDMSVGDRVLQSLSVVCRDCDKDFRTLFGIQQKKLTSFKHIITHLNSKIHESTMCELCFYHRITFAQEDEVFYPVANLNRHTRRFHMKCKLCPGSETYYYDKDHLVEHCRTKHYMCHVCDSTELFFLTSAFLFEHIRVHHFVCSECSSKDHQLTAFLTVKELQEHHKETHPTKFDKNRFKHLIILGKNVDNYEEHPLRETLDQIDGLLRKLYKADRLKYRIIDGPQSAGERAKRA